MLPLTSRGSLSHAALNTECSKRHDQARPCTQVGFLPLHPMRFHTGSHLRLPVGRQGCLCLSARTSLFASLGLPRRALPATVLHLIDVRVRTFLSTLARERLPNAGGQYFIY